MTSREQIQKMYQDMGSWRKVAEIFDLPSRTIHRYANDSTYEPKREDIRQKLGLDNGDDEYVTYVRQVRSRNNGTFQSHK